MVDKIDPSVLYHPRKLDDKISIYKRQVNGWFIEPAWLLLEPMGDQASFVILSICFSYIEGVEQYRQGRTSKNNSKSFFITSFKRIFGSEINDDRVIEKLYTKGRCGLFHDGMTNADVIYDMGLATVFMVVSHNGQEFIHFHPAELLFSIKRDFDGYIQELRQPTNVATRENFNRMYNLT